MITPEQYKVGETYLGAVTLYGLSTDSKPIHYGNGSIFIEVDTGDTYFFNATSKEWVEQFSFQPE